MHTIPAAFEVSQIWQRRGISVWATRIWRYAIFLAVAAGCTVAQVPGVPTTVILLPTIFDAKQFMQAQTSFGQASVDYSSTPSPSSVSWTFSSPVAYSAAIGAYDAILGTFIVSDTQQTLVYVGTIVISSGETSMTIQVPVVVAEFESSFTLNVTQLVPALDDIYLIGPVESASSTFLSDSSTTEYGRYPEPGTIAVLAVVPLGFQYSRSSVASSNQISAHLLNPSSVFRILLTGTNGATASPKTVGFGTASARRSICLKGVERVLS